ncbi:MAG: NUDIX hydrolase [Sphingomicrobium sp.]
MFQIVGENHIRQVAALPYRNDGRGAGATPSILLITSRQTGRWVVPKGNLMVGKAAHEAAAIEAEEEAGVRGITSPISIGEFHYLKLLAGGGSVMAEVELFPLAVTKQMKRWIEQHQRQRRWFSIADAATAVDEVELGELIHRFGEGQGPRPVK